MSGRVGSITTDIVSDGLVFNMDAANRASYIPESDKSYNTIDLSQTGSLQDTGMFSADNKGVWVFDGIDDGIAFNSTSNLGTTSTVSMWVKRTDPTATTGLLGNNANAWQAAWWLTSTTQLYVSLSKWVKPFFYSAGWSNTTDWFNITITRNGDAAIFIQISSISISSNCYIKPISCVAPSGRVEERFNPFTKTDI
jgi:hypothetical protein